MKSICAIVLAIFGILLLASPSTESRNGLAGEYWREVMKNQPMPKAIHGLISQTSESSSTKSKRREDGQHRVSAFTDDFEPQPSATAYPNDQRDDVHRAFTDEFEPIPNVSAYPKDEHDHARRAFTNDFEPIPNVTAYPDGQRDRARSAFTDEFEPTPNVTAYPEDRKAESKPGIAKENKPSSAEEFEPTPNVSVYNA